jgi:lipopolysaccharide transport system ATP-binding protein
MEEKEIVLKVDNISKQYRLGQVGTGTISHDLNRFWSKVRGKEDPYLKLTEKNDREKAGDSDYVWALKNASFELRRGEVLGVIGKNGAGKSTLLKLLSRITSPSSGSIKMKGRISSLLEVGTGFHLELTGRENIFLNGAILGMTKKEIASKLDEIVEFSGCLKYLDTPVKRYSTGMVVRLGFAVAAYLESDILVVDEVLAVGDQEFQNKCIGKMQDISNAGRTVLFVSHNLNSIKNLCTKGLLIENGESVYFGDINTTINKYLNSSESKFEQSIDLSTYKSRIGNGLMKFEKVELFGDNKPTNKLFTGGSLKLKITLSSKQLTRFKLAIHFHRLDDTWLSNITNMDSGFELTPFEGVKTFEVTFESIMFYTDTYKISLWVGDITTHEHIDFLKNCCEFEIVEGSPIVNRSLPKSTGLVYFQPEWKEIN